MHTNVYRTIAHHGTNFLKSIINNRTLNIIGRRQAFKKKVNRDIRSTIIQLTKFCIDSLSTESISLQLF